MRPDRLFEIGPKHTRTITTEYALFEIASVSTMEGGSCVIHFVDTDEFYVASDHFVNSFQPSPGRYLAVSQFGVVTVVPSPEAANMIPVVEPATTAPEIKPRVTKDPTQRTRP